MKMNLVVYTATRGYAWQPSVYSEEDVKRFEKLIGDFPSVRDENFPFGKIFLDGNNIGFCRFHVARRYDFCGRDAFYCVVGTLSRVEAARVDPLKLFALPAFAMPMNPAPTEVEVDAALRMGGGENLNIFHLLKSCSISIDGIKGEGPLSAVFDLDFISLLAVYDHSLKGSMARNELYQKVGDSLGAYADLRRALSQKLVRFPELHKEVLAYLKEDDANSLRQAVSQQLIHTPEMHQTIFGALESVSEDDSKLRRALSDQLIKKPEMQRSVVDYLGIGPSTWRQQVSSKLMASSEMRQVLLAYLEGCSSDWRLALGKKLLEKPELLEEIRQRVINGDHRVCEALSNALVKTLELLQAFCNYLPHASPAEIDKVCKCISVTDTFKKNAFNVILNDLLLRKKLITKCVQTNEFHSVLKENWHRLSRDVLEDLVLSEVGSLIFYSKIEVSKDFRDEVLQNLYSDLSPQDIEDAVSKFRQEKARKEKRLPWWKDVYFSWKNCSIFDKILWGAFITTCVAFLFGVFLLWIHLSITSLCPKCLTTYDDKPQNINIENVEPSNNNTLTNNPPVQVEQELAKSGKETKCPKCLTAYDDKPQNINIENVEPSNNNTLTNNPPVQVEQELAKSGKETNGSRKKSSGHNEREGNK